MEQGLNDDNLFLWMQDIGYQTYYVGKLYNYHSTDNYNDPYARGFNGSDFLLDPYTYQYWNASLTHNGEEPVNYAGNYTTDVVAEKALAFLQEALEKDDPFFLTVAPIAPHSNWVLDYTADVSYLDEPKSAVRHQDLFQDYKIPRTENFNAAIINGGSWTKDLPELNETVLEYNDEYQRQRLRALQAVDEMLLALVTELEEAGQLDNTYIFYTTDNGYHISQYRMQPGKECGYGERRSSDLTSPRKTSSSAANQPLQTPTFIFRSLSAGPMFLAESPPMFSRHTPMLALPCFQLPEFRRCSMGLRCPCTSLIVMSPGMSTPPLSIGVL